MKKIVFNLLAYSFLFNLGLFSSVQAQGCIAVRHMACATGGMSHGPIGTTNTAEQKGQVIFTTGYRFLHSYKHFVGTEEQPERVALGTNVINDSHSFDFGLSYALTNRWSLAINLPYNNNSRSSLYEHYGNSLEANPNQLRFKTHSSGIGDLRLTATRWMVDPTKAVKGNIALGLGIKAPTGNGATKDDFHKLDKEKKDYLVNKFVDQSIQLGDGSWGFNVELQGYQSIFKNASLYYNGFYLFSPANTNAKTTLSVSDQYAGRLGINYSLIPHHGLAVSLGGRLEGLPAIDIIGKSEGFRRPGYILSIEPGIAWMTGHHTFAFNLPVALVRNRTKSFTDRQDPLGLKHGDAAFADYFLSVTYAYRF
ncbi:MAG: hypothetical protein WBP00_02835 [Saprospiraceae bacterium]